MPKRSPPSDLFTEQLARIRAASQLGVVVDLACGRGRHTLAVAAAGIPVIGIDRSRAFLAELREAATQRELAVETLRADLENPAEVPLRSQCCGAALRLLLYPLMAIGLLGVIVWALRGRGTPLATGLLLALALHVCVYACATMPGYSRRYVNCAVLFVPGLAAVIDWAARTRVRAVIVGIVIAACCARQTTLLVLVDLGIISRRTINDVTSYLPDVTGGLWALVSACWG